MSHKPFSGVITAICTPFLNGEVDTEAFKALLIRQKEAGIHGVVVLGTTGESGTLIPMEKDLVVSLALEARTEDFHVYVGAGTNNTHESIENAQKYAQFRDKNGTKPDGIMCVVPYYNKPNQKGLQAHFSAIASSIPNTPFCVYNVPGRTVACLETATFLELVKAHKNITAIKEAAGNVATIAEMANGLRAMGREDVDILSGDDVTYAPALLCGATGVISVSTHLIPKEMLAMWKAAKEGDFKSLQRLHLETLPLNMALFTQPNPIPLKWALANKGMCQNELRLPLTPATRDEVKKLADLWESRAH